jgi:hypothetical protein
LEEAFDERLPSGEATCVVSGDAAKQCRDERFAHGFGLLSAQGVDLVGDGAAARLAAGFSLFRGGVGGCRLLLLLLLLGPAAGSARSRRRRRRRLEQVERRAHALRRLVAVAPRQDEPNRREHVERAHAPHDGRLSRDALGGAAAQGAWGQLPPDVARQLGVKGRDIGRVGDLSAAVGEGGAVDL